MKEQLEDIIKWTSVSGHKIDILYSTYKKISGDNTNHCRRCPAVIRTIFGKVKKYYKDTYEK